MYTNAMERKPQWLRKRYAPSEASDAYAEFAYDKGFDFVASAPFVRSSYNAGEALGR
ncbi:hypothetical protein AGMMS49983_09780 [Clostridia bacterium]|nr:hypothetical protein AGMMS49983_09780 [Clostridia bacterium]